MDDTEYFPISLLSHINYCPRRAALILNERLWSESRDTAKGRAEHSRVHDARMESRGDTVKLYEYTVYSDTLGITGKCDCIEATADDGGCRIPAADFPVKLYPVEFKHGNVREEIEYNVQVCAQAMCLEEMFHTTITEGVIFYISSHRRQVVAIDEALRAKTRDSIAMLRRMREEYSVPRAEYSAKCDKCSLHDDCMPKTKESAKAYCQRLKKEATGENTI